MTTIIIFGAPILLLTIYYFNHLIRRKNEVDNASGSINVMLKNRYDLIPNLVDTVKNYMTYESQILDKLTMMRTQALSSDTSDSEKPEPSLSLSLVEPTLSFFFLKFQNS